MRSINHANLQRKIFSIRGGGLFPETYFSWCEKKNSQVSHFLGRGGGVLWGSMESSLYENWDEIEMLFGHLVISNLQLESGNRQLAVNNWLLLAEGNWKKTIGQTKVSFWFLDRVELIDRLEYLGRPEYTNRLDCLVRIECLDRLECLDRISI